MLCYSYLGHHILIAMAMNVEIFLWCWFVSCPYYCIKQNNNTNCSLPLALNSPDRLGKTHPTHYPADTLCLHNLERNRKNINLYQHSSTPYTTTYLRLRSSQTSSLNFIISFITSMETWVCCLNLMRELLGISCGKFICGQWLLDIIIREATTSL